ncbi:MAG: hypothetical protein D6812_04300, partial [Deltaproteobacteria bacterium]
MIRSTEQGIVPQSCGICLHAPKWEIPTSHAPSIIRFVWKEGETSHVWNLRRIRFMGKHPDFSVKTSTLVSLLRERAENEPDFPVFCFLEQGEREGGRMTFGDLDRRARAIALLLEEQGKRGEPVLLLYEPSLEYIAGLFACFYAGMIAV